MRKLEGRVGRFVVWHVGTSAFSVEDRDGRAWRFTNLSDAFKHARWLHQTNAAFA
jgi:hypothetical protein